MRRLAALLAALLLLTGCGGWDENGWDAFIFYD